jgi:hypothetical protein
MFKPLEMRELLKNYGTPRIFKEFASMRYAIRKRKDVFPEKM